MSISLWVELPAMGGGVIGQVGCGRMLARGLILQGSLYKSEIPPSLPHYSDSTGIRQSPEICTLKQISGVIIIHAARSRDHSV